jgi:hypothetical protein
MWTRKNSRVSAGRRGSISTANNHRQQKQKRKEKLRSEKGELCIRFRRQSRHPRKRDPIHIGYGGDSFVSQPRVASWGPLGGFVLALDFDLTLRGIFLISTG